MSAGDQVFVAWAHSDRYTAPRRTRGRSTSGRDEVSR